MSSLHSGSNKCVHCSGQEYTVHPIDEFLAAKLVAWQLTLLYEFRKSRPDHEWVSSAHFCNPARQPVPF
jgi:hypothetical protein